MRTKLEDFAVWLKNLDSALGGRSDSAVPCGDCTACCTSSQFIYIGPEETSTLECIPRGLLFRAPGRKGYVLGYNEKGACPMFVENRCSIYAHRPRTCRTYDCRIFRAAGIPPDADKPAIASAAARFEFNISSEADKLEQDTVRAAAKFLREHSEVFAGSPPPPTQLAVLAVRLRSSFLSPPGSPDPVCRPSADLVKREIERIEAAAIHSPNSA